MGISLSIPTKERKDLHGIIPSFSRLLVKVVPRFNPNWFNRIPISSKGLPEDLPNSLEVISWAIERIELSWKGSLVDRRLVQYNDIPEASYKWDGLASTDDAKEGKSWRTLLVAVAMAELLWESVSKPCKCSTLKAEEDKSKSFIRRKSFLSIRKRI